MTLHSFITQPNVKVRERALFDIHKKEQKDVIHRKRSLRKNAQNWITENSSFDTQNVRLFLQNSEHRHPIF